MAVKMGRTYDIPGIGRVKISMGTAKGKKFKATRISDGKVVQFGAKGYSISPGTDKGDNYCARSSGIKSSGFSANNLSRWVWNCKGKKSRK